MCAYTVCIVCIITYAVSIYIIPTLVVILHVYLYLVLILSTICFLVHTCVCIGSERVAFSGAKGHRLKEANHINISLRYSTI